MKALEVKCKPCVPVMPTADGTAKLDQRDHGEPGAILSKGSIVDFCRAWPRQKESSVPGIHYLQEDSADTIGPAIADWLRAL